MNTFWNNAKETIVQTYDSRGCKIKKTKVSDQILLHSESNGYTVGHVTEYEDGDTFFWDDIRDQEITDVIRFAYIPCMNH